jgi:imidazolonepropionase
MADLGIVPNGAVLIKKGVIEDVGPARRVENLAGAKHAREIDATGRVVMPAFVDADMALVCPAPSRQFAERTPDDESRALRLMSRQRVQAQAAATAAEWARYGCATVGAWTPCATDMRNIAKVLRTHRALQLKPLRIRSIFSPRPDSDGLVSKWLQSVFQKKLAAVVEFGLDAFPEPLLRQAAIAAAGLGYAIRLRSSAPLQPDDLRLALSAGAIAIVGPYDCQPDFHCALASAGCVRVIPGTLALAKGLPPAADMREAIDAGAAIALASSYRAHETSSFNMQFLLYLAVDRLGLTAAEAITATTWNAACSLRYSHQAGSLEPGKPADLLLMDVPDYRDLPRRAGHHDVGLLVRGGNVVFQAAALIPD